MAKLSTYRLIYKQDYPSQYQSLVDQMATTINAAFTELYNNMNNKLTFTDNFNATVTTLTVTVDANGIPTGNTQFPLASYQTGITGLIVLNCVGSSNPTALPTSGVFVSFTKNASNIIISNIKGLTAGITYSLTLLAIGS